MSVLPKLPGLAPSATALSERPVRPGDGLGEGRAEASGRGSECDDARRLNAGSSSDADSDPADDWEGRDGGGIRNSDGTRSNVFAS